MRYSIRYANHQQLQSADGILREQRVVYTMSGFSCNLCGRVHPDTAKLCHPCSNFDLVSRRCTSEYRVAEYFVILRRCGLWPMTEPFTTVALRDIAYRMKLGQSDHKHQCSAGQSCPLRTTLEHIAHRTQRIIDRIVGIAAELGIPSMATSTGI